MGLGNLEYYLIIVNAVGFVLFALSTRLAPGRAKRLLGGFLMVLAVLGASAGILLAMLLFDRKAVKENMMSRVFVICALAIQIVAYLMINGQPKRTLTFAFFAYLAAHRPLLIYLAVINVITLIAYGIDKRNAVKDRRRIPIVTLLALAFAGGSVGALAGMYLFRHKTQKDYFSVGVPLILLAQVVVLFYVMNYL
ncbi:MAG: DUF1294 domain-containing protein [Lachnospiraceae bacterium]|nr:DUF1294 domain-containing protein [Lachnospiraceae bacterium]